MPVARKATPAKPKAATPRRVAAGPASAPSAVDAAPVVAATVAEAPCAFPLEMRDGKCPVAVFNSAPPASPNERIAYAKGHVKPLAFLKGLLAVFTEREAAIVRQANPGNAYIEGNPKLGDEPLICDACFPKTRWYSAEAFKRHTNVAHVN